MPGGDDPDVEPPPDDAPLAPVLPPSEPARPVALPVTPVAGLDPDRSLPDPGAPTIPSPTIPSPTEPPVALNAAAARAPGEPLIADRSATRNVPVASTRSADYGLPPARDVPVADPGWVRPALEPMGPPTAALLVGRALFVVAALLVGLAAERATGGGRGDVFWPVVVSAGVFAAVGLAGLVFWSAVLAGNARRLKVRCAGAKGMAWIWALPVGWVALSSVTYLRIRVDDDLDPFPGVAAIGWVLAAAIAFGRLQGVSGGLSRTPAKVWLTVFPLDTLAFGLLWWRLTGWPSPVTGDLDEARLTANVAFVAAAILFVDALVYVWLAHKATQGVFERLGRLEAQHRPDDRAPDWFRAGLVARPPGDA